MFFAVICLKVLASSGDLLGVSDTAKLACQFALRRLEKFINCNTLFPIHSMTSISVVGRKCEAVESLSCKALCMGPSFDPLLIALSTLSTSISKNLARMFIFTIGSTLWQ